MSIVLLSALTLASADAPPAPPPQPEQTIVVTGHSLAETERALRDCLARKCPPNEDIDASLAHAENLFVAGKYADARRVTLAAIGRNHRYRKTYPIDVSDLYRANSRIAAHLGEGQDFELSTTEMHRTLADALPKTDPRVIDADLEWADMYAAFGRLERARQVLQEAEHKAEAAGRPDLAGIARVRQAWLYQAGGESWLARQALEKLAADRSPTGHLQRVAALVLLARLDRSQGKLDSSNALVEEMRSLHSKQPVLLFAPTIDLSPRLAEGDAAGDSSSGSESGSVTRLMPTDTFDDRWVDIGFWITPEGKVRDTEILRSHGTTNWTKQLLASISGRLYSPTDDPGGSYRVERYSYTARWMYVTGSRMRQRSPNARIEYVDLTPDRAAGTR
jgi:tetratricopeptide (TPR) repeat protein